MVVLVTFRRMINGIYYEKKGKKDTIDNKENILS